MPRLSEARAEARRQQILDAASACIARQGFHRTTMQEICAEARLSPGSVYSWFPSKRAILQEMIRRRQQTFREAMEAVGEDPLRGMRRYLETVARAARTPTVGWMNLHLLVDGRRDKVARESMRVVQREGVAVLKQALRKLRPRQPADADARARLLQAAAFGIVIQSLIDPKGDVASFEVAERLILPVEG